MPYLVITDQSPNVCFGEVLEMGEDGDSLRSRAPSGYSDATVVGDEEVKKLGGSPGYGVKGEK